MATLGPTVGTPPYRFAGIKDQLFQLRLVLGHAAFIRFQIRRWRLHILCLL